MFDDSEAPPSDRQRDEEWRRTIYNEVKSHGATLQAGLKALYFIAACVALVTVKAFGWL